MSLRPRSIALLAALALSACATPVQPVADSPATPGSEAQGPDPKAAGLYGCHKVSGKIDITFKPGVTLEELVAWAMAFSCKNIVYRSDTGCARVNVVAPASMSVPQAWDLFISSVESLGLELRERGESVAIVGVAEGGACETSRAIARPSRRRAPLREAEVRAKLKASVQQMDEVTFVVARSVIELIERHPAYALRGARIVPSIRNGQPNGFKLYAIRPTSVYAVLGLRNGDTIHRVNGIVLDRWEDALNATGVIKNARDVRLEIIRRGKPVVLHYDIR